MLKKIRVLFLGLVVLAGSACVTPTHASSASPIILTYIQAAGLGGAMAEAVVIYNTTNSEIDITNWCIGNKTPKIFACFNEKEVPGGVNRMFLPAYSYATMASHEYIANPATQDAEVSVVFDISNQSSGNIVNSGDVISLFDESGEEVDSYGWSGVATTGKAWARTLLYSGPDVYVINSTTANWAQIAWKALPESASETRFVELPNSEDEEQNTNEPETPVSDLASVMITEVFANAAGADVGKEFVEIFNPNEQVVISLNGIRLRIGLDTAKWYDLPIDSTIPALGYVSFYDSDLGFSLSNTKGGVQLFKGEEPIGERITYTSPKDDMAWALINGGWQYTNIVTPGLANAPSPEAVMSTANEPTKIPKPCAPNQFRNPETGRCKLLSSASSAATRCKPGQERHEETNRCRTLATTATPTPCKAGQERNPETNRCRNSMKMSEVGHGVKGVQHKSDAQPSWYYWAGIIGVILLVLGYGIWEWREELLVVWRRMKAPFAKQ